MQRKKVFKPSYIFEKKETLPDITNELNLMNFEEESSLFDKSEEEVKK